MFTLLTDPSTCSNSCLVCQEVSHLGFRASLKEHFRTSIRLSKKFVPVYPTTSMEKPKLLGQPKTSQFFRISTYSVLLPLFCSHLGGHTTGTYRTTYRQQYSAHTQSCLTPCNPKDCRLPGSPVHGIFQARILEWVTISYSRGSSRPRD